MTAKRYFGTDGIRGKVGDHPITAEFMLRLGWAAGRVFEREGKGRVLIGKDTRISGYMFESALEAGLVSAGVNVLLLGPMPTPAIAYLTRTFSANAGIVISASHNPYYDNGIKFFSGEGEKLDDEVELRIEAELDQEMTMVDSAKIGRVSRVDDATGRYIEFCKSCFPHHLNLRGLRIVVDCANGATYGIAPDVFSELGAEVIEIGTTPDGLNINEEVGSTVPAFLASRVLRERADFGIAFDGDGDRVVMVDGKGEVVDGDELLMIIANARHEAGKLKGGVVGTLMTNFGLEKALAAKKIPFVRSAVGDRYVLAELLKRDWVLGGESSGHILCLDLTSTGDGIISALQAVAAIVSADKPLHELKQVMTKMPQRMINVKCADPSSLATNKEVSSAVAATEVRLGDTGRVLIRPSGTEPVVRVMVEGEDEALVSALTHDLASAVDEAVN